MFAARAINKQRDGRKKVVVVEEKKKTTRRRKAKEEPVGVKDVTE